MWRIIKKNNILNTSFNVLMEWDLPAEGFWEDDCNGKTEFAVMEKFKHIPHDQCAGYKLALPLGGNASVSNMELLDFKAYLELLAQMHQ